MNFSPKAGRGKQKRYAPALPQGTQTDIRTLPGRPLRGLGHYAKRWTTSTIRRLWSICAEGGAGRVLRAKRNDVGYAD